MSTGQLRSTAATETEKASTLDMKLEVAVLPVADVDRAKQFYGALGWRLDADLVFSEDFRLVQYTPPGSACSIIFGKGVSPAVPGSVQGLWLVVPDIAAARAELLGQGIEVSDLVHPGAKGFVSGPDPEHKSYATFAAFSDPDGNGWLLQEITVRLPGRVEGETKFVSAHELATTLRRAEAAHGEHEKRTGQHDENWPDWYAEYMVREQAGKELPV